MLARGIPLSAVHQLVHAGAPHGMARPALHTTGTPVKNGRWGRGGGAAALAGEGVVKVHMQARGLAMRRACTSGGVRSPSPSPAHGGRLKPSQPTPCFILFAHGGHPKPSQPNPSASFFFAHVCPPFLHMCAHAHRAQPRGQGQHQSMCPPAHAPSSSYMGWAAIMQRHALFGSPCTYSTPERYSSAASIRWRCSRGVQHQSAIGVARSLGTAGRRA